MAVFLPDDYHPKGNSIEPEIVEPAYVMKLALVEGIPMRSPAISVVSADEIGA
jgi:hypothetical protein